MDIELQKYYEALLEMFSSEGWKYYVEDQEAALNSLRETANRDCVTSESWHERRGAINKLEQLINYETAVRATFENIEELEKERKDDAEYDSNAGHEVNLH